jgi:histidinol-phosphate aminotransferase
MPNSLNIIKQRVRELRRYSLRPDRARIKLNQNENPWDAPAEIRTETLRRFESRAWSRYPDFEPRLLHERLAEFAGWQPDGVLTGNGSNELIQALLMVILGPGKRLLISEPTFALYRQIASVLEAEIVSLPLASDLTYDLEGLRAQVKEANPEGTIICSPNNPTGCVIPEDDLESLLELSSGLVVIDEAYFEFAGQTAVPLLRRYSNLVVLRTFSKAMAMAGLRIGYLLAAPEIVNEIWKAIPPGNLDIFSSIAAEVTIELCESTLKPRIELIVHERERLFRGLQGIPGLNPTSSQANFMVVRSTIEPRLLLDKLLRRDILVRDVSSYPMLNDYFRITVGKPEENDELLAALRHIFATEPIPVA